MVKVATCDLRQASMCSRPHPSRGARRFSWEAIRAVAFWLTFFVVAIYLIRSYLEDHPELVETFKKLTFARRIFGILVTFMRLLAAWTQKGLNWRPKLAGQASTSEGASQSKPKKRRRWGAFLQAHSARERVIHAYLQMLQHAAAAGMHRRQHQTPYEYAPELHQAIPDVEDDINALTDVFVHVRYSQAPVDSDHAARAVTHAERVQQALHVQRRHTAP